MATTVGDLLRGMLRKIGVLDPGEPLDDAEGQDALQVFRQLVDSWSTENLLIPVTGVVSKQLINGDNEYTIGVYPTSPAPDTHIETARPIQIIDSYLVDSTGTSFDIERMDVKLYSDISVKSNVARPSRMYVRKGWPLNTLIFDTVPYDAETLKMTVLQPLSEILPIANLTEELNLPPGYERALLYNGALELCDEWGRQVTTIIATIAGDSKKWLKRNNYESVIAYTDASRMTRPSGRGTYIISEGP